MRGAAHHQPKTALRTRRSNVVSDSQKQAMGTSGAKLRPIQEWHDHQGNRSQGMPTSLSCASAPKSSRPRAASMTMYTARPSRKRTRCGPKARTSFLVLDPFFVALAVEFCPEPRADDGATRRVHDRIHPESDERDRRCNRAGADRDNAPPRRSSRPSPYSPVPGFEEVSNEASSRGR